VLSPILTLLAQIPREAKICHATTL
jgi:hypothetical protein